MRALALLLAALALVPFAPAATATGQCVYAVALVCAGDFDTYGSGCTEPNSFGSRSTGVSVLGPAVGAQAGGYESCSNFCIPTFGCFQSYGRGVHAYAFAPVGIAGVDWTSSYGCHTYVTVWPYALGFQQRDLGCPAGPPPAFPWGHVLP